MPWTRKRDVAELARLVLEDADELLADDLALLLGLGRRRRAGRGTAPAASTWTSGTWKWPPNVSTTCSASFSRSRPWSTKTHVSWSPTALWTSSAATAESTPPESAQSTRSVPTCGADALDLLLDHGGRRPRRAARRRRRRGSSSGPPGRAACARPRGGTGRRRARARRPRTRRSASTRTTATTRAPVGRRVDGVAVAHPDGLLGRRGRGRAPPVRRSSVGLAELGDAVRLDARRRARSAISCMP